EARALNGECGYVAAGGWAPLAAWRETCWALLFLCMLDVMVVLPWHAINRKIPIWDGAAFVYNAQQIVDSFDHGWLAGLKGLYLIRGWRPIIFSATAAPFFAIAGRDVLADVALTNLFVSILLTVY